MEQLAKIYEVFSKFDEHNVVYCHWKSIDHLEATYRGDTDIDALFARNQRSLIETILAGCGFVRMDTVVLRAYPGIMDYVALDEESGKWVHLHLHYYLNMGDRWVKSFHLNLEDFILKNRIWNESFQTFTVNPHDELSLLIARMSLKSRVPFSYQESKNELAFLVDEIVKVEKPQSSFELTPVWQETVDMFYSGAPHDLDIVNTKGRSLRREFSTFRRLSYLHFILLSSLRATYRYNVEFRRRFLLRYNYGRRSIPHGGYIVAFVGIDGSGKTTGIRRLEKFFKLQVNVEKTFLGNGLSGASLFRRVLFKSLSKVRAWKKHKKYRSNQATDPSSPPLYYLLWLLITLIEKRRNFKRTLQSAANGNLVLVDRWPQNIIENTLDGRRITKRENMSVLERYLYRLESDIISLSERYRPDLVIKMLVTPSVAMARKPNEFSEKVANDNLKLLENMDYISSNTVIINADLSIVEVDEQCKKLIWNTIKGE